MFLTLLAGSLPYSQLGFLYKGYIMSAITISDLQNYTNDFNTYTHNQLLIDAAQEVVENYLGYKLDSTNYTETYEVVEADYIALEQPIKTITTVKLNGSLTTAYTTIKNIIRFNNTTTGTVEVVYVGGFSTVPNIIKLTILQITTLKLMETGKKIGITGIQTPDGIGNTFINYTNFDKYLSQITAYRQA